MNGPTIFNLMFSHPCLAWQHTAFAKVVGSLDQLYHHGVEMDNGKALKYAVVEIRGDWKWQQEAGSHCFNKILMFRYFILIPKDPITFSDGDWGV